MFPPRCTHPACMNMEVNRVGKSADGLARNRAGTNAHCLTNGSPPLSSTKKNKTFNAISAYVTMGKVRSPLLSPPIGNIECSASSRAWKAEHELFQALSRKGRDQSILKIEPLKVLLHTDALVASMGAHIVDVAERAVHPKRRDTC